MADFTQVHSKIANALQFLGPLVELEAALREAGGVQKFLLDAQPTLQSLKQEIGAHREEILRLRGLEALERENLANLQRAGEQDVKARVTSAEAQLSQDLKRLQGQVRTAEVQVDQTRRHLLQEMAQLAEQRDRLLVEVSNLDAKRESLRADLNKAIAKVSGDA